MTPTDKITVPPLTRFEKLKAWAKNKWRQLPIVWKRVSALVLAVSVFLAALQVIWQFMFPKRSQPATNAQTLIISNAAPLVPLKDAVDLNDLERRYPNGFVVIRESKPDRFETYESGLSLKVDWSKSRIIPRPNDRIYVHLNIQELSVNRPKELLEVKVGNEQYSFTMTNAVSAQYDLGRFLSFRGFFSFTFEILDDHPRRPVFVIGLGLPK